MPEILCFKCWNRSINRYGRSCSIKGLSYPQKTECDRFVMECQQCARKCSVTPPEPTSSGSQTWFCSHCGWTPDGIEGECAINNE